MTIITLAQQQFYRKHGYLMVENIWPDNAINTIKDETKAFFSTFSKSSHLMSDAEFDDCLVTLFEKDFSAYHGAAKLANHGLALLGLSCHSELLTALRDLDCRLPVQCARPVMWFHSPRLAKTPRYQRLPAHQEWSNMQGSYNGMVVWAPLRTVSEEQGRLQVIPGSHKRGLLPFQAEDEEDYPFALAPDAYDEAEFIEIDVPENACLIFSTWLIHRSGINTSNQCRWTFNFRYNDASEPTFIQRHYLNPFHYSASTTLQDDFRPSASDVAPYFHEE